MFKRIFLVGLSLVLFAGIANAESRFNVISDFSKGQNSHITEFAVPQNQGVIVQNLRVNNQYGSLSTRETLLKYGGDGDAGASAILGLHRYYKNDNTAFLICGIGTLLRTGNDSDGSFTTIQDGLTDSKRWSFLTYQNVAIGSNGYDQPKKYDGHTQITANTDGSRTALNLCADLGAPFAELQTGTTLDASSWYQYKMMYYDGSTYYYSNSLSNPILTGADVHNITLTDIPLGPAGVTNRYIYRTEGQADEDSLSGATYKLCITINDNSTQTIADTVADGSLTTTWDTSGKTNATPPKGKYMIINDERLFVAGNPTYPSEMYFSDAYNPDFFTPTDYEAIREDDGDAITFLKMQGGYLIVGKTNTIQKYYTESSSTSDWYVSAPFSFVGCPAPYSAANSPIGIIYYGRFGIYSFTGNTSQLISDAVTDDVRDVASAGLNDCVGFYYNNEYHFSYTSELSGGAYNNRELIYDIVRDAWVKDIKNINCYVAFDAGNDFGTLYSGSSSTDGYIFAHSGSSLVLSKKTKTDLDAGTFDDTRTYGTDDDPELELAWDCTIDTWLTELQTKATLSTISEIATALPDCIIDRPDTDGTWISPGYQVNASTLDKLYWNENLGTYGDITWNVRTASANSSLTAASWSATAVTNPSGSDISGETANTWIQFRSNLSTTNINYSPTLYENDGYVFKMIYSKVGSAYETNISKKWESGWLDFGATGYKTQIERIKIYYTGDEGSITFNLKNEEDDVSQSFTIDLTVNAADSITDQYTGEGIWKVYTYFPPISSPTQTGAVGQWWKYTITSEGVTSWSIYKIETKFAPQEIYD